MNKKRIHAALLGAVLAIVTTACHAQYTTDWLANTFGTLAAHVGNAARSMWVAPEGVIYTSCRDESQSAGRSPEACSGDDRTGRRFHAATAIAARHRYAESYCGQERLCHARNRNLESAVCIDRFSCVISFLFFISFVRANRAQFIAPNIQFYSSRINIKYSLKNAWRTASHPLGWDASSNALRGEYY